MDNTPSHRILNDIVNILKEKNFEFQLGNNSNDNLENLMNKLNIYIKNNLTFQSKKIEVDLSFLKGYENLPEEEKNKILLKGFEQLSDEEKKKYLIKRL